MKIVFIEPKGSSANVYSSLSMPLLGPVYLATLLKNHGYDVEIYNEAFYKPDYSQLKADLIGISILTSTAQRGYEIAKKFPKEKVIIGGIHASLLPQEGLQYARQVVVGEAENVILDICQGKIKDPIVYGKAVENLDTLPNPDFSLIKGWSNKALLTPISTSRGCPFDCSFCSVTKIFGRKYRFRSAQNVMAEIQNQQTKEIFFCDDNFTANPKRTLELLSLMRKNKIVNWSCQVRCEVAKNNRLLKLMRATGCKLVCVGFESVNQKTLQNYEKRQTVQQIIDSIRSFHREKIKVHGMFVLGSEDDNIKTIWDTLKFCVKEKIDTMQMMILTPFPGTKVYDFLESSKRIFTKNWSLYDGHHIVFKPKLVSPKELQQNVVIAYAKFYSVKRALARLFKWQIRNAVFSFIGYLIVNKWRNNYNHATPWIPANLELSNQQNSPFTH